MSVLRDRHLRVPLQTVACLSTVVLCVGLLSRPGSAADSGTTAAERFTAGYYQGVENRFGVGLAPGIVVPGGEAPRHAQITDYDVGLLHIGWYADWSTNPSPLRPEGIDYAQLVLVRASLYPTNTHELTATVSGNPGSLWIIGNEPEAKYNQGKRTPEEYAEIYHDMYTRIKGLDPTSWIAVGGVVQPTPLRLQWLDQVLQEYRDSYGEEMPVDVWNIHTQILQEKAGTPQDPTPWGAEVPVGLPHQDGMLYSIEENANPVLFRQLVLSFRQWMKDRGFQEKPLIISEYGVLMPSDILADGDVGEGDRMVMRFMRKTFDFLVSATDMETGCPQDGFRLVQQWLWYSLNDRPFDGQRLGFNGSLFSHLDPSVWTPFGAVFREYMHAILGLPRILLPRVARLDGVQ